MKCSLLAWFSNRSSHLPANVPKELHSHWHTHKTLKFFNLRTCGHSVDCRFGTSQWRDAEQLRTECCLCYCRVFHSAGNLLFIIFFLVFYLLLFASLFFFLPALAGRVWRHFFFLVTFSPFWAVPELLSREHWCLNAGRVWQSAFVDRPGLFKEIMSKSKTIKN